jgi:hypothetical protein
MRHHPERGPFPMTDALAVSGPAPPARSHRAAPPWAAIAAALLVFVCGLPGSAAAHASAPPPSLASEPGHRVDDPEWHLLFGQAYLDTVTATAAASRSASAAALQSDHWDLKPSGGHLLTQWKPIHHLLFRLFSGKAFGRVFVDVTPLAGRRTQIRFQGVLATHRDIEHNPARGWAEHAYASAVRVWQKEMRDDLTRLDP